MPPTTVKVTLEKVPELGLGSVAMRLLWVPPERLGTTAPVRVDTVSRALPPAWEMCRERDTGLAHRVAGWKSWKTSPSDGRKRKYKNKEPIVTSKIISVLV